MVIRNGWFSFRWSKIFDMGNILSSNNNVNAIPVPVPVSETSSSQKNLPSTDPVTPTVGFPA
jgi:hypothetical protein